MANHGCNSGPLTTGVYSSYYVAMGTFLCLFCIVLDVISGIWRSKRWLPCRFFSPNVAIIFMLSVLPFPNADLPTSMPSTQYQLAKLCGTTLICIYIGIFLPSIGDNNDKENHRQNIFSMAFFLLTVSLVIIIQIKIGVIGLFIEEHMIILCCMWILFYTVYHYAYDIISRKEEAVDYNKSVFTNSKHSMLQRLKLCYIYGFISNPQFVILKHPVCATVGGLCILCTFVLLQAVYRSRSFILRQMKYCYGTPDYGWSIWTIVVIQILTVILGCFITAYRWFYFCNQMKMDWIHKHYGKKSKYVLDMNPHFFLPSSGKFGKRFSTSRRYILEMVIVGLGVAFSEIVAFLVIKPIGYCIRKHKPVDNKSIEEFKQLIHEGEMGFDKWAVQMGVNDMERWIEASKSESLKFMSALLMHTPSSDQLHTMEIRDREHPNQVGLEVSSLSMMLLAKIAEVSIPSSGRSPFLLKVFNEVYEIIHFFDSGFAKALKTCSDFGCLIQNFDLKRSALAEMASTVAILKELKQVFPYGFVRDELCVLIEFVCREHSTSVKDHYDHMERIFADILRALLAKLPHVVSKQVLECPAEEYEENVKRALRILCILQSSFPEGHNMLSWITSPDCSPQTINATTEEVDVAASSSPHIIIEVIDTSVTPS